MQLKRIKNIVEKVGDMLNYIVIYAKEKETMNGYVSRIKVSNYRGLKTR